MTIAWAENIKNITIDKEISEAELNAINSLDLKMFKEDWAGTAEDVKTVIKDTTIKVDGIPNPMKLVDIAEQFDQYVTKGDSWKLKLKDENDANTPEWIKNIINEPTNNDLAFFIQKLAWLIAYQTATAYTDTELNAATVSIDKTFGNQTRRALTGLKSWIESEWDYKNVAEWQIYTGKYLDKSFVEWVVSTQTTNETKNTVLAKYNLQYKEGKIQPKAGYMFADPYSNNLAVVEWSGDVFDVNENVSYKKAIRSEIDNITDIAILLNEYHLIRSSEKNSEGNRVYTCQSWYTWVDKNDINNLAVNIKQSTDVDTKEITTTLTQKQENLVDNLSLIKTGNGLYIRMWYIWFYAFWTDWKLYYSWKEGNQKFVWPLQDNWETVKNVSDMPKKLIENKIVKELSLIRKPFVKNLYIRTWYPWLYSFGKDNVLYYYGMDLSKQSYDSTTKKWSKVDNFPNDIKKRLNTPEIASIVLSLVKTWENTYTRAWYKWKYAFDAAGTLYYAWIDWGKKKLTLSKWNREDIQTIPEEINHIDMV